MTGRAGDSAGGSELRWGLRHDKWPARSQGCGRRFSEGGQASGLVLQGGPMTEAGLGHRVGLSGPASDLVQFLSLKAFTNPPLTLPATQGPSRMSRLERDSATSAHPGHPFPSEATPPRPSPRAVPAPQEVWACRRPRARGTTFFVCRCPTCRKFPSPRPDVFPLGGGGPSHPR